MDSPNGRYWDKPWSLVDGCTPCSPGCEHCWSMAMGKRFHKWPGKVTVRPDRLDIPLRARKPTVFAIWNDLFHEDVPDKFILSACEQMWNIGRHTFLILTKRPKRMAEFFQRHHGYLSYVDHVYAGLTVCNQDEANAKIPELLTIPGKKWLSIEPMLGPIDMESIKFSHPVGFITGVNLVNRTTYSYNDTFDGEAMDNGVDLVILGGETGPGARPMHPDWVRSVRDQCAGAGVPFFFKQWGEYCAGCQLPEDVKSVSNGILMDYLGDTFPEDGCSICSPDSVARLFHIGTKRAGRMLDGRTHDELPWSAKD